MADAARMATAQSAARRMSIRVLMAAPLWSGPRHEQRLEHGAPVHPTPLRSTTDRHMASHAQRLIEAAKKPVPEGTYAVGLGLVVSGIAAYGFQILAFRALPKAEYTALNGLWVIAFVLAPGFFLPLEQEVGRAIAHRRAQHVGGGPVVRRAALAGSRPLRRADLARAARRGRHARRRHRRPRAARCSTASRVLLPCLILALMTYAFQHLTRGTLSGNGRFGPYGLILAAEGIYRHRARC